MWHHFATLRVSEEGWQWYLVTCAPFVGGGDSEKHCGTLVVMVATLIWYLKSRKGLDEVGKLMMPEAFLGYC